MQVSIRFILSITFLNFLADFLMQIIICNANVDADSDTLGCCVMEIRSMGTTSNGPMPIDLLHELLYTNSVVGKMRSQFRKCSPTRHRKRFPRS